MGDEELGEARKLEFCDVINQNAVKLTEASVANEPDLKISPQMRTVSGYFTGGYQNWQDGAYGEQTKRFLRNPKMYITNVQTRKERGFQYKQRSVDRPTTLEELKTWMPTERDANTYTVTAIVSGAGTGKSTLLRRLAHGDAEKCLSKDTAAKITPKMIHFINLKNMKYEENITPSHFLFGGLYSDEREKENAYKWLLDRQSEAIIYFDGLDQSDWSINQSNHKKISPWDKATTAEIMYNILNRNLLPHVKIMMTSREFIVSELPVETRDMRIISLEGFKFQDAQELFVDLVGDRGLEIWDKIMQTHRLTDILMIPTILVMLAAVMVRNPDRPPPATITELYNMIMLNIRQETELHKSRQVAETMKKLKAMAYQGMVDGRVVFYEADLRKFDISHQDAMDLMIKVPGNDFLTQYLLQGDSVVYFCHQSLQEFLSASFVAEMNDDEFVKFNKEYFERARMSTVRIFLSGILHADSQSELHEVSNLEWKRSLFAKGMQSSIINGKKTKQQNGVDLLLAINESNNENLTRSLPHLPSMRGVVFGPDVIQMFVEIVAKRDRSRRESAITLYKCGIDDTLIGILVNEFVQRELTVQVKSLDLRWNSFSVQGLNSLLSVLKVKTIAVDYARYKIIRREFVLQNNGASLPHLGFFRLYVNLRNGRERMLNENDGSWLKMATSTSYYMHELHPAMGYSYEKTPGCCL